MNMLFDLPFYFFLEISEINLTFFLFWSSRTSQAIRIFKQFQFQNILQVSNEIIFIYIVIIVDSLKTFCAKSSCHTKFSQLINMEKNNSLVFTWQEVPLQVILKQVTVFLDWAILFINKKKCICCRTISILFYLLPILQLAESFASDQQIHNGHDIFLTLHKNLCNMLFVVF